MLQRLQRQIWPGVLRWTFPGSLNVATCVTHVVEKHIPKPMQVSLAQTKINQLTKTKPNTPTSTVPQLKTLKQSKYITYHIL